MGLFAQDLAFFQRLPCPFHKVQLFRQALFSKGLPSFKDFPVLFTKSSCCFCPFLKAFAFLQRLSEDLLPFCKDFQKICIFSSHHLPFPKRPFGKGPAGFSQDHLTFSQRSCFSANALIPFDKGYASNTPSVCRMKSFLVSSRCIRILYFRATFCVILVLLTPKDTL